MSELITVTVSLFDPATGKRGVRTIAYPRHCETFERDLQSIDFQWTEGNMSCDCNRLPIIGIHSDVCGERVQLEEIRLADGRILRTNNEIDERFFLYKDGRLYSVNTDKAPF